MSLTEFILDPWKKSHEAYEASFFNLRPAPEYASSEVLVASLYRRLGFAEHSESLVPGAGRLLDRASQSKTTPGEGRISNDTWLTILHGVLESPKLPNQSSRRFLQLSPVIPETSLYSGSARPSGKSWNPGQLIERIISMGAPDEAAAQAIWRRLYDSLSVAHNDDIWARWLREEFEHRSTVNVEWKLGTLLGEGNLQTRDKAGLEYPAKQFFRDIDAIIAAKESMTRRQWISLLEAILRLGSVAHVLWLCHVSDNLWRLTREILTGADIPDRDSLSEKLFRFTTPFAAYGNPLIPTIRDYASRYLSARLGLNFLLWQLHDKGEDITTLKSLDEVISFLTKVQQSARQLREENVLEKIAELREQHTRTLACKKGIGSNIVEFGRHALGQRQAANEILRGYDQGYLLRKGGQYKAAPWVISLGPVAVLALVHCCLDAIDGPRSVQRLATHLSKYGIGIHHADITTSDLGQKLRMLGLVLDSPDAESGMLLVQPFGKLAGAA